MSRKQYFNPNEHDFEEAIFKVTFRDSWEGVRVKCNMVSVDNVPWEGRKIQGNNNSCDAWKVIGHWINNGFFLETLLEKIGPLCTDLYEAGNNYTHYRGLHLFQMSGGKILVPRKARLYLSYANYDAVSMRPVEYCRIDGGSGENSTRDILYNLGYVMSKKPQLTRSPHWDWYSLTHVNGDTYYRNKHEVIVLDEKHDLHFRLEEQSVLPEGLASESRIQWVIDNTIHIDLILPLSDAQDFNQFATEHLKTEHWKERRYIDEGKMQWVDDDSWYNRRNPDEIIRTLSLDIKASGATISPFKELEI